MTDSIWRIIAGIIRQIVGKCSHPRAPNVSGPIIQNGKLAGAVTHVLINDPAKGYGIFIENMLDAAG